MQYLFDEKYNKTVIVKYYNNLNFQIVLSNWIFSKHISCFQCYM